MRLLLHIGFPACGERELFRFADANRASLRRRGLWYPTYEVIRRGRQLAHYDVAHAVVGLPVERFDFEGARRYLSALRRHAGPDETVMLGLPGLITPDDGVDAAETMQYWRLRERTVEATSALVQGFDTRLVVLVRRPDRLVEHRYARAVVRGGYRRSIAAYHRSQAVAFDLSGHIDRWARRFPNLELRTIEQLEADEPPLHRLFASLGTPVADLDAPARWHDATLPARAIQFLRTLNDQDWPDAQRREVSRRLRHHRARVEEICGEDERLLESNTARRIIEEQRLGLEELATRYGYNVPSTLFDLAVADVEAVEECEPATESALFELIHAAPDVGRKPRQPRGAKPTELRTLERRTKTRWWRAIRTAAIAADSEPARRARKGLRPKTRSTARTPAGRRSFPDDPVLGLRSALREHAFDDAAGFVHEAMKATSGCSSAVVSEVALLASAALQATGDEDALRQHVLAHRSALRGTAFDPILYTSSRTDVALSRLLTRDGQINTYVCDQLLQRDRIDVETIASLLAAHPRLHAKHPELDLLLSGFCTARFPAAGTRALNRFLTAHALPAVTSSLGDATGIDRFRFDPMSHGRSGPLVSVIISARNAEDSIVAATRSMLSQSHRDLELLICDDGSSDTTPRRLLRNFAADPRVRLYRSPTNQGPYNVRNALLAHARGEFITFQDADDLALPTRVERQLDAMARRRSAACVANWVRVRPDGTFVFFRDMRATRLSIVSMMVHRSALGRLGPFSPARFGADFEMFHRLQTSLGEQQLARVRAPLIFGMWSTGSLTRTPGAEALESGYRSEARRRYARLALQRAREGDASVPAAAVHELLEETGNYCPPVGVEPLT